MTTTPTARPPPDFQDARAVARELGIPLHRVSFAAEYRARVFDYFLASSAPAARRIPTCSAIARSSSALPRATRSAWAASASRPATTRACARAGGPELLKARDGAKDQSYFLHAVDRDAARATC